MIRKTILTLATVFAVALGCFAKYFIKPDSEETTPSATFDDGKTPGIYNNKI